MPLSLAYTRAHKCAYYIHARTHTYTIVMHSKQHAISRLLYTRHKNVLHTISQKSVPTLLYAQEQYPKRVHLPVSAVSLPRSPQGALGC